MRILLISTHDNRGGAAKAAYRFSKEFQEQGHDVCLYVRDKTLEDPFIIESSKSKILNKIRHLLDFLPGYVLSGFNREVPFTLGLFGERLNSVVEEFKPDIINIHWTWKGFVSFPQICKVSKKIPVVWTMHDSISFAGGSFYPETKNRLIKMLGGINNTLRKSFLKSSNIVFVSPSKLLLNEFNKFSISKKFKGVVINNGLDIDMYRHRENSQDRKDWGLSSGKKYILFGAANLLDDPVKGGKILAEIFREMQNYFKENNIGLIAYGSKDPFKNLELDKEIEVKFVGYIDGDRKMAQLINCCNLVVVPSLYENYPFVVLESLSCGVPVVAFMIGGIPEIINHRVNGYLAEKENKEDMKEGIRFCIKNSLKFGNSTYSISRKTEDYISLFNDCLKTGLS